MQIQKHRTNPNAPTDCTSVPLVLCGDFNSLPDSGKLTLNRSIFSIFLLIISRCD